jgi:hypothetical protein
VLYAGSDTPAALPSNLESSEALKLLTLERQALLVPDHSDNPALASADPCPGVEAGPVLFVPVDQKGGFAAYLAVYRRRGRARYTANETELLLLLASWLGVTLENHRLAAGAERLALTDDTTPSTMSLASSRGALVRRSSAATATVTSSRSSASKSTTWTRTASEHGSANPARMLKRSGGHLAKSVRSFDVLGKDGDSGFVAILPQTGNGDAHEVAERMRAAVAAHSAVTATFERPRFPRKATRSRRVCSRSPNARSVGPHEGRQLRRPRGSARRPNNATSLYANTGAGPGNTTRLVAPCLSPASAPSSPFSASPPRRFPRPRRIPHWSDRFATPGVDGSSRSALTPLPWRHRDRRTLLVRRAASRAQQRRLVGWRALSTPRHRHRQRRALRWSKFG